VHDVDTTLKGNAMSAPAKIPLILAAFLLLSVGIAPGQEARPAATVSTGVVFVLDGSGRLRAMAQDLGTAVAEAGLPLEVRDFNWSYGSGRVLLDLRGRANHSAKGDQLAATIQAQRSSRPEAKVFVVAHSAGAAVAIAATERLPAGTIDRIILLAPALSPSADLRSALRASRNGVDVFYSPSDMISRGLALTGTADGANVRSAGANGFADSEGAGTGLRQHSYTRDMSRSGHLGGHYGWTKIGFLRDYVTPMLAAE
jgi:pimeloyl-ACP methyl ester carboxylesterase